MEHMRRHHGKSHREAEFFKPAHLDLSIIRLDDEVTLPDFLHLLAEQQPEGVVTTTTETAGRVEMKLEVAAEPPLPPSTE